jgi:hypothetical protein
MKNYSPLVSCLIALLLLTVAGCVKDPPSGNPHLPKPEWLLTKVVASEVRAEPEGGPVYHSVTIDEYKYNKYHKPWLHTRYYGTDTNNLQLRGADTIFYDNQLRAVRKGSRAETDWKYESRYFYTGNERLPYKVEEYTTHPGGTSILTNTLGYQYRDTLVYVILPHSDTLVYVYNSKRNYIGLRDPIIGLIENYNAYDNSINAGRFLNVDFPRVLNIQEGDEGPLFSTNNWTNNSLEFIPRVITYDSLGRVNQSRVTYQFPTRNVTSVYYYTSTD